MNNNWIKQAIFYHIYPLGFCGAPRFAHDEATTTHRILKLVDWIDHVKELDINALYLGPIFSSYEHGYDTSDYRVIDPRLGTNEDFKQVADALHNANIRIVLDGVFNHVGRDFWAFQDVLKHREASSYKDWFYHINFQNTSPYGDPFSYEAWEGHYNLVKLNLQNEEVVHYLLESVGYWMDEFHIDGLRLDAADCIDRNFFKRLKQYTKGKKEDFWLVGEIIHGDYNLWANEEMLDSVTNYECYKGLYSSHNTKNYFEIAHSLNRQFGKGGIYEHLTLYNFVDNHDVNRLASTLTNKQDLQNVYTLLYMMPGIPSIYYGSELGLTGTKHDGSDADIRPCLTQDDLDEALPLYQHICRLGEIRKQHPACSYGQYEQVIVKNEQFVFMRKDETEAVYVACNLADEASELELPVTTGLYDLLQDQAYVSQGDHVKIVIPPHDSAIFIQKDISQPLSQKEQKEEVIIPQESSLNQTPEQEAAEVKEETKEIKQEENESTPFKQTEPLPLGRYRHYKGNDYAVLYTAIHSETLEEYVVYRQLYGTGGVWIRPLSMFLEEVEVDGKLVPRFAYLGK